MYFSKQLTWRVLTIYIIIDSRLTSDAVPIWVHADGKEAYIGRRVGEVLGPARGDRVVVFFAARLYTVGGIASTTPFFYYCPSLRGYGWDKSWIPWGGVPIWTVKVDRGPSFPSLSQSDYLLSREVSKESNCTSLAMEWPRSVLAMCFCSQSVPPLPSPPFFATQGPISRTKCGNIAWKLSA